MTGQSTDRRKNPKRGDKGDWYLRLLGIEAESGPTTLSEVAHSKSSARTSGLVTEMWEQTAEIKPVAGTDDLLTDWQPEELSPTVASSRKVRWPIVGAALIVGLAASLALWLLPQASERRAANFADQMRTSLTSLYADLAAVQGALATATEPANTAQDFGSVTIGLAGIADSAGHLLDVANEPVPSPLPLSAREPFDDLAALKVALEPLAAEATSIAAEVATITNYRLSLGQVLAVGELPFTADSAMVTELRTRLAETLADSVGALATMPSNGRFAEHRTLVESSLSAFAQWQDDYLSALRANDAATAKRLVEELDHSRQQLTEELVAPLATLRTEIDGRILTLAERVARATALLP